MSALPAAIGSTILGMSFGSCCPSESRQTTISLPFKAAVVKPMERAWPFPLLLGMLMTLAPACLARSTVLSILPSLTTRTSLTCFLAASTTSAIVFSSLYAGITAVIIGCSWCGSVISLLNPWSCIPGRGNQALCQRFVSAGTLPPGKPLIGVSFLNLLPQESQMMPDCLTDSG